MSENSTPPTNQDEITKGLGEIREKIDDLNLPELTYAGIEIKNGTLHVARTGGEQLTFNQASIDGEDPKKQVIEWFRTRREEKNVKFVAVGINGDNRMTELASQLWLEEDIVPYVLDAGELETEVDTPKDIAKVLAHEVESRFNQLGIAEIRIGDHNEVLPDDLVTLDAYKQTATDHQFNQLKLLAEEFGDRTIRFFSATPRGGGVALMRHALIRILRLLGVDAHWHIMKEKAEAFEVTKTKFHNVLQAVSDPNIELTEEDMNIYNHWIEDNIEILDPVLDDSDVIVIDDPQPSGMIPHIRGAYPDTPILYRSHIQLIAELAESHGTPQHTTWQFLWEDIQMADTFIAHPIDEFVPDAIPSEKIISMPPTTDPLDGLNKPLSERETDYYMNLFNKVLVEHNQTPLDRTRPFITQIARFDPSKGIPDVIESYRRLREKLQGEDVAIPQLVIVGHGSVDDPDGVPVYNLTQEMLKEDDYQSIADDVKVARLHHTDQLLNVIMREAKVGLQLSHKEGFEIKVTEGLMKGVPMIAYRAGGIPLQITDGEGGYLVDEIGDTETVADHMYTLFVDEEEYEKQRNLAKENIRDDVFTVPGAARWLAISLNFIKDGVVSKNRVAKSTEGIMSKLYELPERLGEYFQSK